MARIIYPTRFADQVKLINDINDKHVADAAASILIPFFAENEIVMEDDAKAADDAEVANKIFEKQGKDAEKFYKERDRLFDPIFGQHRRQVQFLKSFFAKNIGKLGDWDVTVNGKRIVYPTDVVAKMTTVLNFIAKHNSYAAGTSPLTAFLADDTNKDIDLAKNETNTGTAKTNHDNAVAANSNKETKRADRDLLMVIPIENYTLTGNFLMNHYNANPNKAGDYGFIVDTSPQGSKVRTGTVNIGSDKVVKKLAMGGVLINNSEFNILIFKGDTPEGTPVTLAPGKPFLIVTGYGTSTIRNPNEEEKAFYQGVFTA